MIPHGPEYLSKFDHSARYVRGATTRVGDPLAFKAETESSYYTGYYPTTDDDGRPFLITFTRSAYFDENMPSGTSVLCLHLAPNHEYVTVLMSKPPPPYLPCKLRIISVGLRMAQRPLEMFLRDTKAR